jgi:hypothetical protein
MGTESTRPSITDVVLYKVSVKVYGTLRLRDNPTLTFTVCSRHGTHFLKLLQSIEVTKSEGQLYLINGNLCSNTSWPIWEWLTNHPRIHQSPFLLMRLLTQSHRGQWRISRRSAFARRSFADRYEIETTTELATGQLNRRAKPWIWGQPLSRHRQFRRRFVYSL